MTLSAHDSSQNVFIAHQYFQFDSQQVHDYHIAWSQTHSKAKLTLLKGHQYHGFASSFQSENWKSQSQVIQAKDLPPLISIPYLKNQVDSTREIIDYQWKHSWNLQPFKFSHDFHAIHKVKGYFKNEVEVTASPKWKYLYSHRSPHPDSFKELSHHAKAIHGNWQHDFYWPLWRVRQVYTWRPYPQHLFTSRIAVIWKASESRNLYISTRSQYPHLENGRMEFQIQWRQKWKAALDQIWLKLSYRLDW